jgi:1,4-alpha-glucan branching enzyme
MKVVHVLLRFDAPGGVETTVREITRRLRAAGEEVEVYASDLYDESHWDRRTGYAAEVDGVPVRRFPVHKRLIPFLTLPLMVGLVDALAESGADVIHAHSHRYGHVLEAAAVAERCRIPLVVSTHYHPADRGEPTIKRGLLRIQDFGFGATAYRVARALVVESKMEAKLVGEFAPSERIHVIPPGIDLSAWASSQEPGSRPAVPSEYYLYVGRIARNKGLHHLVEALSLLPSTARRPLVLMGKDWGERAGLEALARRLGVADQVVWLGHVPDPAEYRAIVRGATAFVLPSEWEAYGLVLLEAMAAHVPVVATSVGALPEVLEEGRDGLLVPYGDPRALARALASVIEEPGAARERVARATTHVAKLDWSESASRLRALYREVAGR